MSPYARHVGRVGALAVALGVGAAVATGQGIGIARADGTEPNPTDSPGSSAPESSGTTTSTGTELSIEPTTTVEPDSDAQSSERPRRQVPRMLLNVSGGARIVSRLRDDVSHLKGKKDNEVGDEGAVKPVAGVADLEIAAPAGADDTTREIRPRILAQHFERSAAKATTFEAPDVAAVKDRRPIAQRWRAERPTPPAPVSQSSRTADAPTFTTLDIDTRAGALRTPALDSARPLRAAPPTLLRVATDVLVAALAPLAAPTPGSPAPPSPVLLGVLGWIRREIQAALGINVYTSTTTTSAVVGEPEFGSATVENGAVSYTPDGDYDGSSDSFTVRTDAVTSLVVSTRRHTVALPVKQTSTTTGYTVTGTATGTTYAIGTPASHGTAAVDTTGGISYTIGEDYDGSDDAFTVTATTTYQVVVKDQNGTEVDTSTVSTSATTGYTVTGEATGTTYAIGTPASHGTAAVDTTGGVSYTANLGYQGTDSFTVTGTTSYDITITEEDGDAVVTTGQTTSTTTYATTSTSTWEVAATPVVGANPRGVAVSADGKYLYVTNQGHGTVSVIEVGQSTDANGATTTTFEVVDTIDGLGGGPSGVAPSPDGKYLYVTNLNGNNVSIIEIGTDEQTGDPTYEVVDTVDVGVSPDNVVVSPDGRYLYVTNAGGFFGSPPGDMSVIEVSQSTDPNGVTTTSFAVVDTVDVGAAPRGLAVSDDGKYVYVAAGGNDAVSVIEVGTDANGDTTHTKVDTIDVGDFPSGVAFSEDGRYLYVSNYLGGTMSVVEIGTDDTGETTYTVVDTVGVGSRPNMLAVSPDGHYIYVVNTDGDNGDTVSVVEVSTDAAGGTTRTLVDSVDVGDFPLEMTVSGDGRYIYVSNANDGTVSVIELSTVSTVSPVAESLSV